MEGKGVEVSGSYGEFDSWSGRFSYGRHFTNGVEMLLSGTYYESAGNPKLVFPSSPSFPGATVRHDDVEWAKNFFASISYGDFTLEGLYGRRDKELPNGPYGSVFNDRRNELWDERAYAELRYSRDFAHDWHLLVRSYFDHYTYEGTFAFDYGDPLNPGVTVNRDTPLARWAGAEVQVAKTLWEKHLVTAGVEGRYDIEQHQENYDVAPAFTYLDASKPAHSIGAYAQGEFSILKELTLNAGVRLDYFNTFGTTVNPRAGLIYQPWKASTLKALYGQAYRAPNAFEFDFENANYAANHNLQPETVRSYEVVWEQAIALHYRFTTTLFDNQVNDLITQGVNPGDGRFIFRNTDSVDVLGAGAELEGNWGNGFRGRMSYTFAEAVDNATDRWLNNSPRHVGKLQFTAPLYPNKLFVGLELQAMSDRRTVQGRTAKGFAIANVTLFSRELAKNLELSASLYNIFDKKYYDPASPDFAQDLNPQDGRTFRVKLTYKF
jgi:iron complex outermembrane receptor protein